MTGFACGLWLMEPGASGRNFKVVNGLNIRVNAWDAAGRTKGEQRRLGSRWERSRKSLRHKGLQTRIFLDFARFPR